MERAGNREDLNDFPPSPFSQLDKRPQRTFFSVQANIHLEKRNGQKVVNKRVSYVPGSLPNTR